MTYIPISDVKSLDSLNSLRTDVILYMPLRQRMNDLALYVLLLNRKTHASAGYTQLTVFLALFQCYFTFENRYQINLCRFYVDSTRPIKNKEL
jgi:hypothetical protein